MDLAECNNYAGRMAPLPQDPMQQQDYLPPQNITLTTPRGTTLDGYIYPQQPDGVTFMQTYTYVEARRQAENQQKNLALACMQQRGWTFRRQ